MKKDDALEFSVGGILRPIELTPQQEDLCERLDELNQRTIKGSEFSLMFRGAVFALREENRSNPDWMAQSAHSLREILYQFSHKNLNRVEVFKEYGSVTADDEKFKEIVGRVNGKITAVAHHQKVLSIEQYKQLFEDFQRVLLWALDRQVDVHRQIDLFFSNAPPGKRVK